MLSTKLDSFHPPLLFNDENVEKTKEMDYSTSCTALQVFDFSQTVQKPVYSEYQIVEYTPKWAESQKENHDEKTNHASISEKTDNDTNMQLVLFTPIPVSPFGVYIDVESLADELGELIDGMSIRTLSHKYYSQKKRLYRLHGRQYGALMKMSREEKKNPNNKVHADVLRKKLLSFRKTSQFLYTPESFSKLDKLEQNKCLHVIDGQI